MEVTKGEFPCALKEGDALPPMCCAARCFLASVSVFFIIYLFAFVGAFVAPVCVCVFGRFNDKGSRALQQSHGGSLSNRAPRTRNSRLLGYFFVGISVLGCVSRAKIRAF